MKTFNSIKLLSTWFDARESNVAFDFQTRCVCSLYARLLREAKLNFPEGRGVVAKFGPDVRDGRYSSPAISFGQFESRKDIRDFFSQDEMGKRKYTLGLINFVVESLREYMDFDFDKFSEVSRKMENMGYQNTWEWKKGSKYFERKIKSRVFIDHRVDRFDIRLNIEDRTGFLIAEGVVFSGNKPDEIIIDGYLGEFRWIDSSAIEIASKIRSEAPITVKLDALEVKMEPKTVG